MNRSPLHQFNVDLGARMVDFGGWEMPVQYTSVLDEHRSVRDSAGFFDVSHLGRFSLTGVGAAAALDRLLCNNLARIGPGRAQYTMMLNQSGGVIDDIILWWHGENDYWVMPNASNQPTVMAAFAAEAGCQVADLQMETAMIALQGPDADSIFERIVGEIPRRFRTIESKWQGGTLTIAGTGYTGEKGGEIVTDSDTAIQLAVELVGAGVAPCGLGARDTLRLEAGFPLWGQDLDEARTPLEADLEFAVDFSHDFVGRAALDRQRDSGLPSLLAGFVVDGPGIPRHGYPVVSGASTGVVTSGNMSPMLGKGIGMAYMEPPVEDSAALEVEIRGRRVGGHFKKPPFHKETTR
jgi:aminomethyltransferase